MNFEKAFKGFYKSIGEAGKQPVLSHNDTDKLITYNEADKQFDSFVGYLDNDYILVDIDNKNSQGQYDDNKTQSNMLIEILKAKGVDTPIVETPHGHHFYFKCNDDLKSLTDVYTPIGLKVDYKLGNKKGCACMKSLGHLRTIINDSNDIAPLPKWLIHNKCLNNTLGELEAIKEKTGSRNDFISRYKYQLLKSGYDKDVTSKILTIINQYIFKEPLDDNEMTILLRDENIEADDFLYITDKGKVKVHCRKLAQKIVRDFNIIRLDKSKSLYSYDDYYYKRMEKQDIERYIYKLHNDITLNELSEVYKKTELEAPFKQEQLNYIALNNGMFNLDTLKLEPHDKDKITTIRMDIDYKDDTIKETPIEKYLMEQVQNDTCWYWNIAEFLGQALYRKENILQKALVIRGNRNNGKSKFLQILTHFFGVNNVSSLDLKKFEERFSLADIVDKIVNIGDDISNQFIPESSNIKKVITSEMLPVEKKGQDLFNYKPRAICIFSCNDMPKFSDDTGAIKRRFHFIEFNNTYSVEAGNIDPFIVNKMTTKENMTALFNIAVAGLKRILINNGVTESAKSTILSNKFDKNNNPILEFIDDTIGNTIEDYKINLNNMSVQKIYALYDLWCNSNGYKPMNASNFGKQLKQHIPNLKKVKGETDSITKNRPYKYVIE